ncbi:MAG: NYN domain-containing protein [Anaerolineae bacterium]|nr:NYN domain-containing protein [Anaerolineae bacterium]
MHFLIDGHNLIAKMPDISLSDPDDEAQLILRLRTWVAANMKRRVTVYFDGGLPGGREPHLSAARLEVVFASGGRPADDMLIRHIRRVKNPPEYTLISSDRAIIAAAEKRRMPFLLAQDFAPELAPDEPEPAPPPPSIADKPMLSEAEVAAWLELFGPEPELPKQPPRRHRRRRAPDAPAKPDAEKPATIEPVPPRDPAELKESGEPLTPEEVAAWLAAFEERPAPPPEEEPEAGTKPARRKRRRKKASTTARPADTLKASGAALSADEVDEWLDIFRERDADS